MNFVTTALIALDLSWVQEQVRENESTGYSSLTRALVLASQAGRMTRLLRVMHLVYFVRVSPSSAHICSNNSSEISSPVLLAELPLSLWQALPQDRQMAYFAGLGGSFI